MRVLKSFLFVLLTGGLLITTPAWQVLAATQIEVIFRVSMDELTKMLPEKMTVYRCSPDESGIAQREALQSILGKDAYFELQEASGGIFTGDMKRLWAQSPDFSAEKKNKPDEKLILASAEKFLAKINGKPGEQKVVRRVSIDTMEVMNKKAERRSFPFGVNVTYRRLMDGYEVVGPGGKLKTYHNTIGEVIGYQKVWRRLIPEKEKQPLISLDQAIEQFKKDPLGRTPLKDVKKVEVQKIRVAYLEHGITVSQKYLQPIYLFNCIAHVKSGDRTAQTPYVRYMEALVKSPEALWPSGLKHEAQARPEEKAKPGED